MEKGISLENVFLEFPLMLIDTCSLFSSLDDSVNMHKSISEEETIKYINNISESADFFRRFIGNGYNFKVTQDIFDEYTHEVEYPHRENREVIDAKKAKSNEVKKLAKLLNSFGIVELNEDERKIYAHIHEKYFFLMDKHGISEIDFDFLISGAVLSETRNSTCLISNDHSILYSWNDILREGLVDERRFGFFRRSGFDNFERGYVNSIK